MSLRENHQAIIFFPEVEHKEYYSIRLEDGTTQSIAGVLMQLEKEWKAIYPANPFEHTFLNATYQNQYDADIKFSKVFNLFTVLAITLAYLGLIGLVSFITLSRTKEIGIRKVLGSTTGQITFLLLTDVGKLLLLAGMLAVPLAYFTLRLWLSQFAFRIDLTWLIFAMPLISVALLALVSISYQVIKAAMADPVRSLKYE